MLVIAGAFIGYSRLTAKSPHDQAVANLKDFLHNTPYSKVYCDQNPSPANRVATHVFGSSAKLFDCQVVSEGTVEPYCIVVGGDLSSNETAGQGDSKCSHLGGPPSGVGNTPGTS